MFINLFVYAAVADDRAGSSCRLSHGQPHFKFAAGCSSALRSPGCGLKSELLSCRTEARSLQTDIVLLLLSTWLRQNYTAQDVSRVRRFSKWPCDQNLHHVRSCNMYSTLPTCLARTSKTGNFGMFRQNEHLFFSPMSGKVEIQRRTM